jgi:hypothetical protein
MNFTTATLPPEVARKLGISQPKPRAERGTGKHSKKKARARVETQFLLRWNGPAYVTEHVFHPNRKWRLDYAWPEHRVGLEIEGGIFTRGAHVRPRGIADDIAKANAASECGWTVYRACDLNDVDDVIRQIKAAIDASGGTDSQRHDVCAAETSQKAG